MHHRHTKRIKTGRTSTRVLFVGDPHFDETNKPLTDILHSETLALVDRMLPDAVVVLGDILDRFETVRTPTQTRAVRFLQDLSEKTQLVVLIGNHDLVNHEDYLSGVHGFAALAKWKNTVLVDRPISFKIKNLRVLGVPYVSKGRLLEAFADYKFSPLDFDLVVSHQEYRGAHMGIFVSEDGDVWPEHFPLNVSGHIHDHTWLQENLCYVGMPYMRRSEDARDKALSMFVWSDTPLAVAKEIRIPLSVKKKLRLIFSVPEALAWGAESGPDDEMVHVEVRGTAEELLRFECSGLSETWQAAGIKVVKRRVYAPYNQIQQVPLRQTYRETLQAMVKNECDALLHELFVQTLTSHGLLHQ